MHGRSTKGQSQPGHPALTAGYTGDDLRAWKQPNGGSKTYFLYDGAMPVCELDSTGAVSAYNTFGANGLLSRRVGSTSTFHTFDPQGGVAQRLDSTGAIVASSMFDAYGTRVSTDSSTDPFSGYGAQWGYYTDSETGLQLTTFRYYDPATGRFVNRDPIGFAGGINRYGYTGNNPANMVDPSGLWTWGDVLSTGDDTFLFGAGGAAIDAWNKYRGGCGNGWDALGRGLLLAGAIGLNFIPGESEANAALHAGEEGLDLAKGLKTVVEDCALCFVAGTPVQMADGTTKPIEKIKVGDEVVSRNPETGKTEAKKVLKTFVHEHKSTLHVILANGDQIESSPEQPFFVEGKGFVAAGDLQPGMALTSLNGMVVKVLSVSPKQSDVTVYNLEVEKDHSYFVGKANGGVLVHNGCGSGGSPALRSDPYSPTEVEARIRPPYDVNPKHVPGMQGYIPGADILPGDAEAVYANAEQSPIGTWWGEGTEGWYRYFSDNAGTAHYSGTFPRNEVPAWIVRGQ